MNTAMTWCPYLGDYSSDINYDHIIPLCLGGHNSLTIPSDKDVHAIITNEVDSYWGNHSIFAPIRQKYSLKGQSGKKPHYRTQAIVSGFNGMVDWNGKSAIFRTGRNQTRYGLTHKRPLNSGEKISLKVEINSHKFIRLMSKVGLGIGYQFFGSTFKNYGHHNILRELLFSEKADDLLKTKLKLKTEENFWLTSFANIYDFEKTIDPWMPLLMAHPQKISAIINYTQSEVVLGISFFGCFKSYMNIAKNTYKFDYKDGDDLGFCVEIDFPKRNYQVVPLRQRLHEFHNLHEAPAYAKKLLKRL